MYAEDHQQQTDDDNQCRSNELEMIINEKLWKGERNKHRRRTKYT